MSDKNRRRTAVDFIIKSRARRRKHFSARLFADPAWDILLAAYAAGLDGQEVSISTLTTAAKVSRSTVERWLAELEKDGLISRNLHASEERVSLSEMGWLAMDSYFEGMSSGLI